ncbi:MAG: hypothetical protein WCP21_20380, partial [Armatimonadota bacterium]
MWFLALFALLLGIPALAADPPVSPSLEADAEYLLTTTDFMEAQFGMAVVAAEGTAAAAPYSTFSLSI